MPMMATIISSIKVKPCCRGYVSWMGLPLRKKLRQTLQHAPLPTAVTHTGVTYHSSATRLRGGGFACMATLFLQFDASSADIFNHWASSQAKAKAKCSLIAAGCHRLRSKRNRSFNMISAQPCCSRATKTALPVDFCLAQGLRSGAIAPTSQKRRLSQAPRAGRSGYQPSRRKRWALCLKPWRNLQ